MLLTPTYYVFRMYKYHQNAQLLESFAETAQIGANGYNVPDISESVSMDESGNIHITLGNLSLDTVKEMEIEFSEKKAKQVTASILTGQMNAHNTFENPEAVKEQPFIDFTVTAKGTIKLAVPPCSVIHMKVKA